VRVLLAILLLAAASRAQEPVTLRTELRPEGAVWVGQRVSFYVTVVMAGRPDYSPRFDLSRVEGALFLQAPGSPVLGTETVGATEYTSQRFDLMLFAQREGELEVPPVQVRVALGGDEHALETEPFRFRARLPDGAKAGAPLITTSKLSIEESWNPVPRDTVVGSAFVRTIEIQAKDVLGLAVPPAPAPRVEGLAVYPSDPIVDDRMARGALECTRTDRLTLVCSRPGTYELPALVYIWWNPDQQRLEHQELPGHHFVVTPDPNAAVSDASGTASRAAWPILAALALLAVPLWFLRARLSRSWSAWRQRRAESEPARFRRLQHACRASDAKAAWSALVAWIDHVSCSRQVSVVQEFAMSRGARELAVAAEELQRSMLSGAPWTGSRLARAVTRARRTGPPVRSGSGRLPATLNPRPAGRRSEHQG